MINVAHIEYMDRSTTEMRGYITAEFQQAGIAMFTFQNSVEIVTLHNVFGISCTEEEA